MVYLYLMIAIIAEVAGTLALKPAEGFTKLGPSILVVVGYAVSFYLLSVILKTLPIGITYAIWSGVGIVLTAILAAVIFKQTPDMPAIVGMTFIVVGVGIIQLFSQAHID